MNNGWVLTSERMPNRKDVGRDEFHVWVTNSAGHKLRRMWDFVDANDQAWRPIDPPPTFVPSAVYRDAKFPEDWNKEVSCADRKDVSVWSAGKLAGYAKGAELPWLLVRGLSVECYKFCRIQVQP
jgi:hypothetical protein